MVRFIYVEALMLIATENREWYDPHLLQLLF